MTSYAKPMPAPRGMPTSQGMDGSLVPTPPMESDDTDGRPKPAVRPKPKVLPKPLAKVPSTDAGLTPASSMPWSPKSPRSEVPSAEKINLLTGPKPYGATSSSIGVRRPSLTFRRQTSQSLPVDEVCSSIVAPEFKAAPPVVLSALPSSGAQSHDALGLAMQTEVNNVRREPVCQEPAIAGTNAKDGRPPVMKKPAVAFHVKPVLGATKPGRFPGTTVDQILAKMEEEKGTGLALGSDRPWAQRSSVSFDGGYRFSSTPCSSFQRRPSAGESPQEGEEERASKEVGSSGPAGAPDHPPLQGSTAQSTTKQPPGAVERSTPQESALPSDKIPERSTDFDSTAMGHLKEADSSAVTCVAADSLSAETSSLWNKAPASIPETKSSTVVQNSNRVLLEEEPHSSLLLSRKPLVPSEIPPAVEKDTSTRVEQELPSTLSAVGETRGPANAPVSSRTSLEKELVSSLLLGGAPLVPSLLESPALDRVSTKETEAIEASTPLKDSHSFARDPHLIESSHRKVMTDTPSMSERSIGGMEWSLSESFEWSSPARRSEWSKMTANAPSPSRDEDSIDQRLSSNAGGVSDPCTGTVQGLYLPHGLSTGRSQEHPEVEMVAEMDQTRSGASTTTDLSFSSQEAMEQEHPINVQDYETSYEKGAVPWREHRPYSGNQTESVTHGSSRGKGVISMTTPEMLKKKDDLIASSRMVDVGLPSGTYDAHGSYSAHGSTEEPPEEASGERSRTVMFKAEEVFEPHTMTTNVLQVEFNPGLDSSAELAGAREMVEPLRPFLLSDPAAEPCVLVHGLGPLEHAMSSREDDSCLAKLEDRGERTESRSSYVHEIEEPQSMAHAPDQGGMHIFTANAGKAFEVSEFDPIRSGLVTKKELDTGGARSQWLEELLSPTSAAEDVELTPQEAPPSAESKNSLLGWSEKDFDTRVSEKIGQSKSVWDDQYGFGGTNRSQELDFTNSEWSKKHGFEESSWRKELEPPNTDWSVKHNMGDLKQSGESDISHMDWSATQSVEDRTYVEEPDVGGRTWSLKQSEEDQRAEAAVIGRDYSTKHGFELTADGEKPEVGPRDWSISHSMEDRTLSKDPQILHHDLVGEKSDSDKPGFSSIDWSMKHRMEEEEQSQEPGMIGREWSLNPSMGDGALSAEPGMSGREWSLKPSMGDGAPSAEAGMSGREWSLKPSMGDGAPSGEPDILGKDWSIKHNVEDTSPSKDPEIDIGDLSIKQSMGEKYPGVESGVIGRDWSFSHTLMDSDKDRELEISNHDVSSNEAETDGSRKQNIGEIGISEAFAAKSKDWTTDQRTESDAERRFLGDAYNVTGTSQLDEGVYRDLESRMDVGETEKGSDLDRMDRLREIVHEVNERRDEREAERYMPIQAAEIEIGNGEVERTCKSSVEAVERLPDVRDGQVHRSYVPYGESPEPGDALNTRSSMDQSIGDTLQAERPSSSLLDEILGRGTSRQSPQNERPTSMHSSHSQESEEKPMDYSSPSRMEVDSPRKSLEAVSPIQTLTDVEQSQSDESKVVDRFMRMEEAGEAPEEMEESQLQEVDFSFLEETEVLDCSVHRTRASLSRKRGHRVPTARPGAAVNSTECDGDDWMFQDSTEPKVPRPDSSDEERNAAAAAAAQVAEAAVEEEQPQKSSKKSPVSQGKKLGIFAGFNPLALKAKLKSRKSAEEGEQPKSPRQKDNFQRSKSCKLPAESAKPPVLPPKPEKSSGSESSTPQWLNALKIKKKPPK